MPLMVLTASSTFFVISVSTCSGEAPGLLTVTMTVGRSIFGRRSTPSPKKENPPITVRCEDQHRRKDGPLNTDLREFVHSCFYWRTAAPS